MINLLAIALLQAARPNPMGSIIMVVAFIAIFYFLLLRPQRKIQEQHRKMVEAVKKGDEVMTDGGIIGQIVHVAEDRMTIRTAESTRIVVARNKIAKVMTASTETSETK
jgi:preprotein translocase subunit YajC